MIVQAILLSYTKYGDHDAVLHCFCKESGFESFYAKGIYAKKNKKKAFLFPLNEVQIQISDKKKSIKDVLKIEQVNNEFFSSDIKINSVLFFVSDLLNQLLRSEQKNELFYHETLMFLTELYEGNFSAHLVFMFQILKIQGLQPLFSDNDCLNPESGNFQSVEVHHLFNKETSLIWKNLLQSDLPYQLKFSRQQKQDFLDSLLVYYQFHIAEFKIPKSLEIIQEIF